jgi:hypothetical protein
MLRKTTFALVAVAALGGTALAPTSASAWGWYDGWGGFHGVWNGWALGYYYPVPWRFYRLLRAPPPVVRPGERHIPWE